MAPRFSILTLNRRETIYDIIDLMNFVIYFDELKEMTNLINNPKMFNGVTDDLAIKPCIPH